MKINFAELVLTCGSWQEAQRIADSLLEKQLVVCVEFIPIRSKYRWQGKFEEAEEIKLVMKSIMANFAKIEKEVAKLHSYKTFVLEAIPVAETSKNAAKWLEKEAGL